MEQSQATAVINSAKTKQPGLVSHFQKVLTENDLTHAYLFSGESGAGKLAVALTITMARFCPNVESGLPCGRCNECVRIASGQHPDVLMIKPDGASIKIDQVRLLKAEFSKSAVEGNQKAFIIEDADKMTQEAANSLLKFVEEPVGQVVAFLLTDNRALMLPTIVSRTQLVEFPALAPAVFKAELKAAGIPNSQFNLVAALTNDVATVKQWAENDWFQKVQHFVAQWFGQINELNPLAFSMVQIELLPLVTNKAAQRVVVNMMIEVWRDVLDVKFNAVTDSELKFPQISGTIHQIAFRIPSRKLLSIIELMLKNNRELTMNINFQNVIEAATLGALETLDNRN